jgi:predicted TIM-barrel fold metal-dependent hydrolase
MDYHYCQRSSLKKILYFAINKVIGFVTKISGAAKHMDEQNSYIYELSQMCPNRIIQAYWINPLSHNCLIKLQDDYVRYKFKLIKLHQCWHKFDISCENATKIIEWALERYIPPFTLFPLLALTKFTCASFCFYSYYRLPRLNPKAYFEELQLHDLH